MSLTIVAKQILNTLTDVVITCTQFFHARCPGNVAFGVSVDHESWSAVYGWEPTQIVWLVKAWLVTHGMHGDSHPISSVQPRPMECRVICKPEHLVLSVDDDEEHLNLAFNKSIHKQHVREYLRRVGNRTTVPSFQRPQGPHMTIAADPRNDIKRIAQHVNAAASALVSGYRHAELPTHAYGDMYLQRIVFEPYFSHPRLLGASLAQTRCRDAFSRWLCRGRKQRAVHMIHGASWSGYESMIEAALCEYAGRPGYWEVHRVCSTEVATLLKLHSAVVFFTSYQARLEFIGAVEHHEDRVVTSTWNAAAYINDIPGESRACTPKKCVYESMDWVATSNVVLADELAVTLRDTDKTGILWIPYTSSVCWEQDEHVGRYADIAVSRYALKRVNLPRTCAHANIELIASKLRNAAGIGYECACDDSDCAFRVVTCGRDEHNNHNERLEMRTTGTCVRLPCAMLYPALMVVNSSRDVFVWCVDELYQWIIYNENIWALVYEWSTRRDAERDNISVCFHLLLMSLNKLMHLDP